MVQVYLFLILSLIKFEGICCNSVSETFREGAACASHGEHSKARELFEKIINDEEASLAAKNYSNFNLSKLHIMNGEWKEALENLNVAKFVLEDNPKRVLETLILKIFCSLNLVGEENFSIDDRVRYLADSANLLHEISRVENFLETTKRSNPYSDCIKSLTALFFSKNSTFGKSFAIEKFRNKNIGELAKNLTAMLKMYDFMMEKFFKDFGSERNGEVRGLFAEICDRILNVWKILGDIAKNIGDNSDDSKNKNDTGVVKFFVDMGYNAFLVCRDLLKEGKLWKGYVSYKESIVLLKIVVAINEGNGILWELFEERMSLTRNCDVFDEWLQAIRACDAIIYKNILGILENLGDKEDKTIYILKWYKGKIEAPGTLNKIGIVGDMYFVKGITTNESDLLEKLFFAACKFQNDKDDIIELLARAISLKNRFLFLVDNKGGDKEKAIAVIMNDIGEHSKSKDIFRLVGECLKLWNPMGWIVANLDLLKDKNDKLEVVEQLISFCESVENESEELSFKVLRLLRNLRANIREAENSENSDVSSKFLNNVDTFVEQIKRKINGEHFEDALSLVKTAKDDQNHSLTLHDIGSNHFSIVPNNFVEDFVDMLRNSQELALETILNLENFGNNSNDKDKNDDKKKLPPNLWEDIELMYKRIQSLDKDVLFLLEQHTIDFADILIKQQESMQLLQEIEDMLKNNQDQDDNKDNDNSGGGGEDQNDNEGSKEQNNSLPQDFVELIQRLDDEDKKVGEEEKTVRKGLRPW